jgi:hypothetical protein
MGHGTNAWHISGALLGLALALALIVISRPGAAGSPLPAALRVSLVPTGELEASPAPPKPLLVANALRPGGPAATAGFQLRNQTGTDLSVSLRAKSGSSALNGLLRIRLEAEGKALAATTLQGLSLRPATLDLASGGRRRLRITAWIPRQVLSGYEGRLVPVSLVPALRPLGAGS